MWLNNQQYCKILVLGEKSVGKTSLISLLTESSSEKNRILEGNSPYETYLSSSTYIPTKYPQKCIYTLNDALTLFFVELPSDFQSSKSSSSKLEDWITESDFCIIVYDTTRYSSWRECESKYFPYLLNDTNKILLIGSKLDLEDEREVPLDEVEEFARNHGIFWMELTKFGQNVALTKSILNIRTGHWIESAQQNNSKLGLFENLSEMNKNLPKQQIKQQVKQQIDKPLSTLNGKTQKEKQTNSTNDFNVNASVGLQHIRELGNDLETYISNFNQSTSSSRPIRNSIEMEDFVINENIHELYKSPHSFSNILEKPSNRSPSGWKDIDFDEEDIPQVNEELPFSSFSHKPNSLLDFPNHEIVHETKHAKQAKQVTNHESNHEAKKKNSKNFGLSSDLNDSIVDDFLSPHNLYIPKQDKVSIDIGNVRYQPNPITNTNSITISNPNSNLSHPKAKIQSFQETNQGKLVPIIEINLDNDTEKKKSVQRKIHVDINIGDGRVGQLAIAPGDNVYYLSQLFVKAFNLNVAYVPYIAHLVRNTVVKYIEKQNHKPKPKHLTPVSEGGFAPFSFETEARAKVKRLKEPIVKMKFDLPGGKIGTVVVRKGDNPHALAKNFVHIYGLQESLVDHIASKIQHQLYIYYSNQENIITKHETPEKSTIPTPQSIQHSNLHSNRVSHGAQGTTKNISGKKSKNVTKSIDYSSLEVQRSDQDSRMNPSRNLHQQPSQNNSENGFQRVRSPLTTNSGQNPTTTDKRNPFSNRKVLFNMEVEIRENEKHTFPVYEHASPFEVAKAFCEKHGLGSKHLSILEKLVQENIELFQRNKR